MTTYERVELPAYDTAHTVHYKISDERLARTIIIQTGLQADRYDLRGAAYAVDPAGALLTDPDWAPIGDKRTLVVERAGLGDTATLEPGWIRLADDQRGVADFTPDQIVTAIPTEPGEIGQEVYVSDEVPGGGEVYRYVTGTFETARQGLVAGLERQLAAVDARPEPPVDVEP